MPLQATFHAQPEHGPAYTTISDQQLILRSRATHLEYPSACIPVHIPSMPVVEATPPMPRMMPSETHCHSLLVHVSPLHRIVLLCERDQTCALQGLKERVLHYLPNSSGRSRRRSSTPCRASCAVFRGTVWCILGLGVPCIVLANGRRQGARFEYCFLG